ncbi:MAG TPA: hypothetical protein PLA68_05085 [Panacibacter sp.]|nr:hypothetical protein [Panacibacter sp.]
MLFEDFTACIESGSMAESLSVYLKALWLDANGNWEAAHNLIDDMEDAKACRVHAYLHRKEGDNGNANYWYRKAGRTMPSLSLKQEWESIVRSLL